MDVINIAADRKKFMTLNGVPGTLVENRRFNLPHLFGAPLGVTPFEFR